MAPRSSRHSVFDPPAHRRSKRRFAGLRIEQLESRIAPALFTVQSPVTVSGSGNYGSIATGDFNADGKTDMVLTNYGTAGPGNLAGGNVISVLLGNGNGTFGSASNFTLGSNYYVSFVAVGDLNGDSKQDLAVASSTEDSTGRLSIYLGNGSGGFTASNQNPIATGSSNACWVGIAQVTNGDSNADVVVLGFGDSDQGQSTIFGNNINVFQGDGTGAVSSIGTITNGLSFIPTALAIADFDGDGDMDFAATVPGVPPDVGAAQPSGIVQMFSGNGAGGFSLGNSFSSGGALPISIQVAHLNGDTLPDLVIANAGDPDSANSYANFGINSSVGVAMNTGGMNFNTNSLTAGLGVSGSKSVFAVAVADFDVDGKQDIAGIVYGNPATGANARVLEYKGDGAGGFAADANSPYNTSTTDGQYLVAAPLDANASPDIVYSNAVGKYGVLLNTTVTGPSVTINKGSSQADPTNLTSIVFDVVFSEGVTGFAGSDIVFTGSSGGTPSASVSAISTTAYTVTVTGFSGTGTVRASIPAGAATSISASADNMASTSSDNQVAFDLVSPTVTINQASGQADPTTTGPILFTVVFSENVTGFGNSDIDLSSSSLSGLSAVVSGSGPTYTVSVTGMVGDGTVVAKVLAGAAVDALGNTSVSSTSGDNTVTFGTPSSPLVTINRGASQPDLTNATAIVFDVVFSEGVSGFAGGDVGLSGSSGSGIGLFASVTPISSSLYTVTVTGMTGTGMVRATIPGGMAASISSSLPNQASTSSDNQVDFDLVAPTVTINKAAGQADPATSGPIFFTVIFSEAVSGFGTGDIDLSSSSLSGLSAAVVQNSPTNYTVTVSNISGDGTVVAKVAAGVATDTAGNGNAASTSTDNAVIVDTVPPSVTIDQAVGQADPTNVSSIKFDVKFTEPVTGFDVFDVSLAGSTAGGTLVKTVSGSLGTYTVTVTGMTTRGSVVATIPAGVAIDAGGNPNFAATSTDNSVEFLNTGTIGFTQIVYDAVVEGTAIQIATITVTRAGQTEGAVSIRYGTNDGTARSGGQPARGLSDYTPVSDILSWADGEGGDRTFTVEIRPDSLNEGNELINLSLTSPVGSPSLGLIDAMLPIAPSDGQGPGLTLDEDGDKVTVKLNGKIGSLLFYRTDPDGDGKGPIELIELKDTLPDPLRPRASLVISVAKADKTTNGTVGLGAITGSGLKSISARKANLNLEGIDLDGYLGSLTIGNISDGANITTQATANPLQKTRINALSIGDGTTIDVECAISNLTTLRVGIGTILAPSIGMMVVKGQAKPAIIGDMASDITLTGTGVAIGKPVLGYLWVKGAIPDGADIVAPSAGTIIVKNDLAGDISISGVDVDPTKRALTALRVSGAVTGSNITVGGNVGSVVVGAFRDSRLFAGYTGPDIPDPVGFDMPATVTTFRSTGKVAGFQNSCVIATSFKTVALASLDSTNATYFGFYADSSLGSINVTGPTPFKYIPELSGLQGVNDFEVMIV